MAILELDRVQTETPERADEGLFFYDTPTTDSVRESIGWWQDIALDTAAMMKDPTISDSRKHVLSYRLRFALHKVGKYLDETADDLVVNISGVIHPGARLETLNEEFGTETDDGQQLVIPKDSIGRVAINPLWDRAERHGPITGSTPIVDVRIVAKADEPIRLHEGELPPAGRWTRIPLGDIEFCPIEC